MSKQPNILNQVEGYWEKLAMLLVHHFVPEGETVTIDLDEVQLLQIKAMTGRAVFYTHGHERSIEFGIITAAKAAELAATHPNVQIKEV